MLSTTKSTSMNGTSKIEDKIVMTFSVSIPSAGNISFSKQIMDKKLYLENQEECDSDYANFEAEVTTTLKEG